MEGGPEADKLAFDADAVAAAAGLETGFHIHAAEGIEDVEDSLAKSGQRVIHRLHDAGILGPRSIVAHAVHVDESEMDVLAQTGVAGLAIWLRMVGAILWQGFRLMMRLRGRRGFIEAVANMAFAGTIACNDIMAFGDWLLPFAYTQTIAGFDYAVFNWIFMGTIIAIDHLVPQTPALSPEVSA